MGAVAVELGMLGAVEVWIDGRTVDLGHLRQASVLAALAVDANRPVTVEQLVDRVWGERPPDGARNTLYGYLHRVRRALRGAPDVVIERRAVGYTLVVDPTAIDLVRFERLVEAGRSETDSGRALALFDEALALWRGEPLASLDTPWFEEVRRRLQRIRLDVEGDRAESALHAKRHVKVVGVLTELTEAHPLDERLAGLLMSALHQSGRQADALHHYQEIRRRLVDEVGTEPAAPLRELHQRILRDESEEEYNSAETDASRGGDQVVERHRPVPRQLPAAARWFTGRHDELVQLDKAVDVADAAKVMVVDGPAGIGKTWLALAWAHQAVERFDDGQLYVNLRGFDQAAEPLEPVIALLGFLDALGVAPDDAPGDPQTLATLYRSMLADRRMLVVLDNAHDTDQVVPLLPGSPGCAVLITSRHQLVGLSTGYSARSISLRPMNDDEGREVFVQHLGRDRVTAESESITALVAACAGLPLAMGIVAARAAARPGLPLVVLVEDLRQGRLDALDTGELSSDLRSAFATSHRVLAPDTAELFALLGTAPGPDTGAAAAAVLGDLPQPRTRRLLRELERGNLVEQHVPGRYRLHDLVRLYAAEQADPAAAEAASRRLVDFLLRTAHLADRLLNPHHEPLDPPPEDGPTEHVTDLDEARRWFDVEHPTLLAAQRDRPDDAWRLAWVLDGYLWRRGHLLYHVAAWQAGLNAARRSGDEDIQARAYRRLGHAYARAGQHDEALKHLDRALAATAGGNPEDEARAYDVLAWLWAAKNDHRRALEHAIRLLDVCTTAGLAARLPNAFNTVGWYHAHLGEHGPAREHCERSLELHREHGNRDGEACALDSLGYIALHDGRPDEAVEHHGAAAEAFGSVDNIYEQANSLANLGDAQEAAGRPADARRAWLQALALYREQNRTADVAQVVTRFAGESEASES